MNNVQQEILDAIEVALLERVSKSLRLQELTNASSPWSGEQLLRMEIRSLVDRIMDDESNE